MADTTTLRLVLPPGWYDLDLDPATRPESVRALVAEQADGSAGTAFTDDLTRLLDQHAALAYEQGAVRASLFAKDLGGERVSAALVVLVVAGQGGTDPAGGAGVARGLAGLFGDNATPEARQLPAGPAVRLRQRQAGSLGGPKIPVECVQYLVPSPDGSRVVLLNFSTPNLDLADAFAELFDAVAETFAWG